MTESNIRRDVSGNGATPTPEWHPLEGELYYRGELARRRRRKVARLEERVLGAFEEVHWARVIKNPFAGESVDAPEQLIEAIRRLNDSLLVGSLRFHAQDDGALAWWEDCEPSAAGDASEGPAGNALNKTNKP
jgi:hypothetical protein